MIMFGCNSVEDVKIPESSGNFFKPKDGITKIRFLAGPVIYFESQEFNDEKKPVGDKKYYAEGDELAKKDKNAKLTFSYIIYDYSDEEVKQWNISTKGLLKTIQALNGLNPDLSLMDCQLTKKKGSNGFNEFSLVSGQAKVFEIQKVIDLFKEENPFLKMLEFISDKIEESKNLQNIKNTEKEFEQKKSKPVSQKEAEDVFDSPTEGGKEPATQTKARAEAQAKEVVEDDSFN